MSPREILMLAGRRLSKSAKIDQVGELSPFKLPGAIDGYGQGWSVLVTDKHGHTFQVTVTMYSLGIE